MKIYRWKSYFLRGKNLEYAEIIVLARTVEEARGLVRDQYRNNPIAFQNVGREISATPNIISSPDVIIIR